jgi:hypothetical protein
MNKEMVIKYRIKYKKQQNKTNEQDKQNKIIYTYLYKLLAVNKKCHKKEYATNKYIYIIYYIYTNKTTIVHIKYG